MIVSCCCSSCAITCSFSLTICRRTYTLTSSSRSSKNFLIKSTRLKTLRSSDRLMKPFSPASCLRYPSRRLVTLSHHSISLYRLACCLVTSSHLSISSRRLVTLSHHSISSYRLACCLVTSSHQSISSRHLVTSSHNSISARHLVTSSRHIVSSRRLVSRSRFTGQSYLAVFPTECTSESLLELHTGELQRVLRLTQHMRRRRNCRPTWTLSGSSNCKLAPHSLGGVTSAKASAWHVLLHFRCSRNRRYFCLKSWRIQRPIRETPIWSSFYCGSITTSTSHPPVSSLAELLELFSTILILLWVFKKCMHLSCYELFISIYHDIAHIHTLLGSCYPHYWAVAQPPRVLQKRAEPVVASLLYLSEERFR